MSTFYVLDVPENATVPDIAAMDPAVSVDKVGPYFRISSPSVIVVDRRAIVRDPGLVAGDHAAGRARLQPGCSRTGSWSSATVGGS